jgi:phosphate starvation-inducible PhoH-like protein
VAAPTELAPQAVPMDPYALGRLVGDASASAPTAAPCTMPDAGTTGTTGPSAGPPTGPVPASPSGATVQLLARVPATALARRTSVPSAYLNNSSDVRLAVLQGLLDTDGGQVGRHGRSCRVRFSTPSARLRDDVVFLVRSLGGIAHTRTRALGHLRGTPRRRAGDGRDRDVLHVLDLEMAPDVAPFRAAGKREAYERGAGGRPARFIDTIEPAGEQDTVCIQVAAEDSLYVTDDFLLTHNTLNDAFVVLDEAQNTSPEQMKMFLTRLGFGSKMVVTGDVTQVDLPSGTRSGLRVVEDILTDIEDVSFNRLTAHDVVRHRLVGHIVAAYDEYEARGEPGAPTPDAHRRGPRSTRA